MDADGLPLIGPGIDFTKVESIHQKRTLAFLNHFITQTVNFLNKFSRVCESKLEEMHQRMRSLEASLAILEAKLASIPGLESAELPPPSDSTPSLPPPEPSMAPTPPENDKGAEFSADSSPALPPQASSTPPINKDARYMRFFKMLQVGVPAMAVKMKMQQEGVDPALLDTPDAPAPPETASKDPSHSDSDDSGSSFSD